MPRITMTNLGTPAQRAQARILLQDMRQETAVVLQDARNRAGQLEESAGEAADQRQMPPAAKRFYRGVRQYVSAQKKAMAELDDRISTLENLIAADGAVVDQMGGFLGIQGFEGTSGVQKLANVFATWVNRNDTPKNAEALALAEAIEQLGADTSANRALATLVRLFGYYDPEVGLSSIWTADAPAAAPATDATKQEAYQELYDDFVAAGKQAVADQIAVAAAELGYPIDITP